MVAASKPTSSLS